MAIKIDLEYLKNRPVSYSALQHFVRSPKHYLHYLTGPRKKSPALALGSAVDCMLLPTVEFEKRFAVHPNYNPWTFDGKAMLEIFAQDNPGKILISKDEYEKATMMKNAVLENDEARNILEQITDFQKELRWIDEETGIPCLAYLDGIGKDITAELKTAKDASQTSFMRDAFNFGYHFQTGIYKIGQASTNCLTKNYRYIVVEKELPFAVAIYEPTKDYVEAGKKIFRKVLKDFKYCMDNDLFESGYGFWAGNDEKVLSLDLPPWSKKQFY